MITAQMVKELRERTGAGMMNCKKALTKANGDMEKAIEVLRENGLATAAKKSGRTTAEGLVDAFISSDYKRGSLVEVNCETDFVSANGEFKEFVKNAAKQAAFSKTDSPEELVKENYIANSSVTLKDALTSLIAKLGENMAIRRFAKFSTEKGLVLSYIHGEGKIGVLVELSCDSVNDVTKTVGKEIAMQIAAANPLFLNRESVDNKTLEKEKEIYKVEALNEGKPEKIAVRMVEGKVKKYYKQSCLLEQEWIKDSDYSIEKYLKEKSKEAGFPIEVKRFARFEKGEGIEKKEENFAEEVKKQIEQTK